MPVPDPAADPRRALPKDPLHSQRSRAGALKSWANTVDRAARTAKARAASPASLEYHLTRLDPERFAEATDEQRLAAADAARRAHFARIAARSLELRGGAE